MQETRYAILIGNSQYPSDEKFADLGAPERDVDGLAEVLGDSRIGEFQKIKCLKNTPHDEILKETLRVLTEVKKNDLVLFYFSGHGKLDKQGKLYLATSNTESNLLGATAVPLEQVKTFIDDCRSIRIVIILDCCFSGAAGKTFTRSSPDDSIGLISGGRGKYIMTASTAIQVAQEKEGEKYSVFTKHLIEGLKTGDADLNGNGQITIDELYQYVYTKVREENHQEPMKWDKDRKGELVIARSPRKPEEESQPSPMVARVRFDRIVQMFEKGNVIPFLGPGISCNGAKTKPPVFEELAQHLAQKAGFSQNSDPLTLISQKIRIFDGRWIMYEKLREIYRPEPYPYTPALTHRFLAQIQSPLLIISTAYDTLLEEAFDKVGKKYVVVTHILYSESNADRGKVILQYSNRKEGIEKLLSEDLVIDVKKWSVIYKIHGAFDLLDQDSGDEIDSLVVSEEDYISLLTMLENPQTTIPNYFTKLFKRRMFLFLGYSMLDWNYRVVVDTIQRKANFRRIHPYAVRKNATEFEKMYWEDKRVRIIDADISEFIRDIAKAIGMQFN